MLLLLRYSVVIQLGASPITSGHHRYCYIEMSFKQRDTAEETLTAFDNAVEVNASLLSSASPSRLGNGFDVSP